MGVEQNEPVRLTRDPILVDGRTAPGWSASGSEWQGRWWWGHGRSTWGLGLGTVAYGLRGTGSVPGRVDPAATSFAGSVGLLTLGMRYRTTDSATIFADAAAWHGSAVERRNALVGKVGLELKSAQSFLNISYGGLGMRLADDTRLTVRPRRGGIGLFVRSEF
jgi:hypothetical protein